MLPICLMNAYNQQQVKPFKQVQITREMHFYLIEFNSEKKTNRSDIVMKIGS